jgi:18S rRNA (guanine1575-N7)-methyltransferase
MSDIIGYDPSYFYTKEESKKYDKSKSISKIQTNLTDLVLTELNLKPNSYILDAGCGSGISSSHLISNSHKVLGIDISKNMLELAKNKGIETLHCSFEQILEKNNKLNKTFDAIISISALQWVQGKNTLDEKEKYKKIAKEFHKILKENGKLGLQFYPSKEGLNLKQIFYIFKQSGFSGKIITYKGESNQKADINIIILTKR